MKPITDGVCSLRGYRCPLCIASPRWRETVGTTSPCGDDRGPEAPTVDTNIIHKGPELWAELHKLGLVMDAGVTSHTDAVRYLAWMKKRLPCGDCQAFYVDYLATHPPTFDGGFFNWTVTLHNAVNTKLGKPLVTEETARTLWTK